MNRRARTETFDRTEIKRLRADFLLLMKNATRVATTPEAVRFGAAVAQFRRHLEQVVYRELLPAIQKKHGDTYAGRDIAKKVWSLAQELSVPIEDPRRPFVQKYRPWITEEDAFRAYLQVRDRWLARIKDKARAAWIALDEYFEYLSPNQPSVEVRRPQVDQLQVAGFSVQVVGAETPDQARYLRQIFESLRYFRERAARVLPWMVRNALPFRVTYEEGEMGKAAGTYNHDGTISLSGYWAAQTEPAQGARVIAHEMGHHVWNGYLSEADREYWSAAIRSDRGDLNLRELLAAWPPGKSAYWIEGSPLRESDPVLYLQIYTALHPPQRDWKEFGSREEVERRLAEGVETVPVPRNPITVYASKNPEEAFCEALGMVVAYGEKAVLGEVYGWLRTILPGLRKASAQRVAAAWLRTPRAPSQRTAADASREDLRAFRQEIPEYELSILAGDGGPVTEEDLERAREVYQKVRQGVQDNADICSLNSSVCSQNLGIPRDQMPQIPDRSVADLLASDDASDRSKGEAAVAAGADPAETRPMVELFVEFLGQNGISVQDPDPAQLVPVGKLRATQKEIKAGKTYAIADSYFKGEYDPTEVPLLITSDNHILDGHHRWSAMLTADPELGMLVRRIGAPVRKVLELAFKMPGVFRMNLQDEPVPVDSPRTEHDPRVRVAIRYVRSLQP